MEVKGNKLEDKADHYCSIAQSTLLYGCECWALKAPSSFPVKMFAKDSGYLLLNDITKLNLLQRRSQNDIIVKRVD